MNGRFNPEDDFYLEPKVLADGVTKLKGYCKFCGQPIEEKSGFCNDTCRSLYYMDIGKMTKKDWEVLAKTDKSILTGYNS